MLKKWFAILGFLLFSAGLVIIIYFSDFGSQTWRSSWKSKGEFFFGIGYQLTYEITETMEIKIPRKIRISDSPSIEIIYTYAITSEIADAVEYSIAEASEYSEVRIGVSGVNFEIVPSETIIRSMRPQEVAHFIWIIAPRKLGRQGLIISFTGVSKQLLEAVRLEDKTNTDLSEVTVTSTVYQLNYANRVVDEPRLYKIDVVDTFGLSIQVITMLGYLASFGGAALGVPWIYERIKEAREKRQKEAEKHPKILLP